MSTTPSTPLRTTTSTPLKPSVLDARLQKQAEAIHPYLCFGFKFGSEIVYISDVSHIPNEKWSMIVSKQQAEKPLPMLVLDCLRLQPHTSHLGFEGSVEVARRIKALRTYFTGFSHEVSHDEWVTLGEAVGGKEKEGELTDLEEKGMKFIHPGEKVWIRPAHDGLRVFIDAGGNLWDETY